MARAGDGTAINAQRVTVVAYGPDPRQWGFFRRLSGVLQRAQMGREGTRVLDPVTTFHGTVDSGQRFTGLAPLGVAGPVVERTAELGDERSAGLFDDTATRIFAERLRRGAR